jgi:L-threonylcarbamoyladenylate synthase
MLTLSTNDPGALPAAVQALTSGQVIVLPTDTVYGLAGSPQHPGAVVGIFSAKRRPPDVHLPVLAASSTQVRQLGVELGTFGEALAAAWWPGPLTLALGFGDGPRPGWLEGRDEVAVRIPNSPFVLAVLAQTGPLLVTSANQHGSATPPSAEEAAEVLAPHVTVLIDGGTLVSAPSTLVNVRGGRAVVEREGAISRQEIAASLEGVR